jgi:hypothetical protein
MRNKAVQLKMQKQIQPPNKAKQNQQQKKKKKTGSHCFSLTHTELISQQVEALSILLRDLRPLRDAVLHAPQQRALPHVLFVEEQAVARACVRFHVLSTSSHHLRRRQFSRA